MYSSQIGTLNIFQNYFIFPEKDHLKNVQLNADVCNVLGTEVNLLSSMFRSLLLKMKGAAFHPKSITAAPSL